MTSSKQERPKFDALKAAALSVAGLVTLVALICLVLASLLDEGAARRVIENVAAVIFAIGLVQILSDAYLHAHLTTEVLERVDEAVGRIATDVLTRLEELERALELDQALSPTGLTELRRTPPASWAEVFRDTSTLDLVPWSLDAWQEQEWQGVLQRVADHPMEVRVYLPNAQSPDVCAFEVRFSEDAVEIERRLRTLAQGLKASWQATATAGSVLSILTYDRPPGWGCFVAETKWGLLIAPATGPRPGIQPLIALAEQGSDPGFLEWLREEVNALGATLFDQVDLT
jgi:hypothetical protein